MGRAKGPSLARLTNETQPGRRTAAIFTDRHYRGSRAGAQTRTRKCSHAANAAVQNVLGAENDWLGARVTRAKARSGNSERSAQRPLRAPVRPAPALVTRSHSLGPIACPGWRRVPQRRGRPRLAHSAPKSFRTKKEAPPTSVSGAFKKLWQTDEGGETPSAAWVSA